MSNKEYSIDFSDLEQSKEDAKEKKSRLVDFSSFVFGLLLGGLIAAPINLALSVISYQNENLVYGPLVIWSSAPWWSVPFISGIVLVSLISVLIFAYLMWVGLEGYETASLSVETSKASQLEFDLSDFVVDEGESLGLDVKYSKRSKDGITNIKIPSPFLSLFQLFSLVDMVESKKSHKIECEDPYRYLLYGVALSRSTPFLEHIFPKDVLVFDLDSSTSDVSDIRVKFDPKSGKAMELLEMVEEEFGQ